MFPVHDIDALLLLATALAAKRRPAGPVDIVAALDLIQGNIPGEEKLVEAFARLGRCGLLQATGDGIAPSPAAEALVQQLPRKGEHALRLFELKGLLGHYRGPEDAPEILLDAGELRAAILAHRAAAAGPAKNLLVPKPKPEAGQASKPGQRQRKPMPKARKR